MASKHVARFDADEQWLEAHEEELFVRARAGYREHGRGALYISLGADGELVREPWYVPADTFGRRSLARQARASRDSLGAYLTDYNPEWFAVFVVYRPDGAAYPYLRARVPEGFGHASGT